MDADLYVPVDGWLHRTDPRVKFLISIVMLALCLVWRNWAFVLGILILEHVMLATDHVPAERIGWVWKILAVLIVFIVVLWPVFDQSGTHVLWQWGWLRLTQENLLMAAVMGLRIPALGFACFITLFTTSQTKLVRGFTSLGMPYKAGLTLATALRYIPVFFSIFQSVSDAQRARGLDLSGKVNAAGKKRNVFVRLVDRFKSYLPIIIAVLIRAYKMSQSVGWAMESRGLNLNRNGAKRTYRVNLTMRIADWIILAITVAATAVSVWLMTWLFPAENPQEFEDAIQENTKLVYFETFGNPNADLPDFEAISEIAHKHHLPVIVDNTFATPYLFRPLEHGADVVVESATKFIGGHGTTLGGVIVEGGKFNWAEVPGKFPTLTEPDPSYHGLNFYEALGGAAFVTRVRAILLRDTGATLSPFAAFLLLQGTETLSLRVERHVQNALKVVEYLQTVPEVESVSHPSIPGRPDHDLYEKYFPNGAGSIFTFDIKGGKDAARVFIDNLHLFSLLANVADAKSLVIHPASTTHSQETLEELEDQGIHQGTIRLSIGTENIEDILDDLKGGFEALRASGLAK